MPRHDRRSGKQFRAGLWPLTAYRSPAGFGIRLDAGTAYAGAIITRFYDSLLVKVTAWSPTPEETIARMHRALWEFRIRGVVTNLRFLDQLIMHPRFATADYTTKFIDQTPELFRIPRKRDRATRLLSFIGDVIVNGNPEVKGRGQAEATGVSAAAARAACCRRHRPARSRSSTSWGRRNSPQWMLAQKRVLLTDTSMRDAHQSSAGDALSNPRHGADRAVLREPAAAAVLRRMLGRRDFRCRHEVS